MLFTDEDLQELSLTRGGLLLFALLCGGDYDSGIEDCGALTAHGLVKCGFGDRLIDAFDNLSGAELELFMSAWRLELCLELSTNSQKMLSQRQRSVASRIDDTFPNPHVLNLYMNPLTSWTTVPPNIPDANMWIAQEPSLHDLTIFCSEHFHWDTEELLKKFSNLVWSGALLQMIYSVSILFRSHLLIQTHQVIATLIIQWLYEVTFDSELSGHRSPKQANGATGPTRKRIGHHGPSAQNHGLKLKFCQLDERSISTGLSRRRQCLGTRSAPPSFIAVA